MEYLYWLAALTVCVLVLAWFVYNAPKKSDVDELYRQAVVQLQREIKIINDKFKSDIDA
jgi:hypothetical protein